MKSGVWFELRSIMTIIAGPVAFRARLRSSLRHWKGRTLELKVDIALLAHIDCLCLVSSGYDTGPFSRPGFGKSGVSLLQAPGRCLAFRTHIKDRALSSEDVFGKTAGLYAQTRDRISS